MGENAGAANTANRSEEFTSSRKDRSHGPQRPHDRNNIHDIDRGARWHFKNGGIRLSWYGGDVSHGRDLAAASGFRALVGVRLGILDELTGLYNRRGFLRAVEQTIGRPASRRETRAVLLLDLDRFKEVNGGLGHQVGDQVLAALAARLLAVLGPEDLLARSGGDEFAVLTTVTSAEELDLLAHRLLDVIRQPLVVGGIAIPIDASIGVAVETDAVVSGVGERTFELWRCAETAMFRAKADRAGYLRHAAMGPDGQREALELAAHLRGLLSSPPGGGQGQLELHYQALVATSETASPRLEALVRWRHPQRGLIAPDHFIGLAERTGLTPLLTRRVVTMALDQVARWRQAGSAVGVSVNLSASDLLHPTLADEVLAGLASRGLAADVLTVEITEQVALDDLDAGRDVLARLRHAGIGVAIDDFGTGFSALSYLHRLPATELKLDRSLTMCIADDPAARAIARSCIDLAHTLGLEVVAEGVETLGEAEALVTSGADRLQGWLFGKAELAGPQPPATVFPLLALAARG